MKEKNYWEEFCKTGKIEDYLKYKNEVKTYSENGENKCKSKPKES